MLRTAHVLLLIALLAAASCGGQKQGDGGSLDPGNTVQPGGAGNGGGSGGEIGSAIDQPGPLVISAEDAHTMRFPLRIVSADGSVEEIATAEELVARLGGQAAPALPGGVAAKPAVEYVRLFYATDRAREAPGLRTIIAPLLPSALAFLGALLLTRLLLRWLKEEVRRVAYVVGALVLIASGGFVVRGVLLSLETLRLSGSTPPT